MSGQKRFGRFRLFEIQSIASTNEFSLELLEFDPLEHVVLAGRQTAGKGSNGRFWFSDHKGLYCTFGLRFACGSEPDIANAAIHSIFFALRAILPLTSEPRRRGINDVLVNGRKIAGVLVERARRKDWYAVGIGLNIAQPSLDLLPFSTSLEAFGLLQITPLAICELIACELDQILGAPPNESCMNWQSNDQTHLAPELGNTLSQAVETLYLTSKSSTSEFEKELERLGYHYFEINAQSPHTTSSDSPSREAFAAIWEETSGFPKGTFDQRMSLDRDMDYLATGLPFRDHPFASPEDWPRIVSDAIRCAIRGGAIRFEEAAAHIIATAFAQVGTDKLAQCTRSSALSCLHRTTMFPVADLVSELTEVLLPSLSFECSVRRIQMSGGLDFYVVPQEPRLGTRELQEFFLRYPALARVLAAKVIFWTSSMVLFLERLFRDLPRLSEITGISCDSPGPLRLEKAASDAHHGGQHVLIVYFGDQHRIVYKPRNCVMEHMLSEVIHEITKQVPSIRIDTPTPLLRAEYSWCRFVRASEPQCDDDFLELSHNCGALLAVLFALGAGDMHAENILIENGRVPVVIDAEVLLLGEVRRKVSPSKEVADVRSLLAMGILPKWEESLDADPVDISLFGSHCFAKKMRDRSFRLQCVESLVRGYQQAANWLHVNADRLMTIVQQFLASCACPARFVFRPTAVYHRMIQSARNPELMRNSVRRSLVLDSMLCQALLFGSEKPREWDLVAEERESLLLEDYPCFSVNLGVGRLRAEGCLTCKHFEASGLEVVSQRLQMFESYYVTQHTEIIRTSFEVAAWHSEPVAVPLRGVTQSSSDSNTPENLAVSIGNTLLSRATRTDKPDFMWVDPSLNPRTGRYHLNIGDMSLYSGASGIAVFFASLYAFTERRDFRIAMLKTLSPIILAVENPTAVQQLIATSEIGMARGAAGYLYSLCYCARAADDSTLLLPASEIVAGIKKASFTRPHATDFLEGLSGLLAALLLYRDVTADESVLDVSRQIAEEILRRRTMTSTGNRAWRDPLTGKVLLGASHGAAGISYVLSKAGVYCDRPEFLDAAVEAINYENTAVSGSWPDLRCDSSVGPNAWCHGSVGIGISRIGVLKLIRTGQYISPILADFRSQLEKDVIRSVTSIPETSLCALDQLCCGVAGQLELLTSLDGLFPERLDLGAKQRKFLLEELSSTLSMGKLRFLSCTKETPYLCGLFSGVAGVGFSLLRAASPKKLPSILLAE